MPLFLISTISIAYASSALYSNIQHYAIGPQGTLTLVLAAPTGNGFQVQLSATFKANGVGYEGAAIAFYHCTSEGGIAGADTTPLAIVSTDVNGVANSLQIEAGNREYNYVAVYGAI